MVPGKGVEPSRLAALAPKASVSANSTTRAHQHFTSAFLFLQNEFAILNSNLTINAMNIKKTFIIILLSIFILPTLAFALNFEVGEEIFSTETINDDYYGAGGTVQMQSDVNGDLMMAGGKLSIDSTVSQDLTLAGGDIIVSGEVGDDARIGGGNVTINSTVKDDLIVGGGNVELGSNGFVGGNFIFGAGNVIINGIVNGNLQGSAGNVYINNEIKGNVKLLGVENVRFGPNGKVLGNFFYRSPKISETVNKETVKGEIEFKLAEIPEEKIKAIGRGLVAGFSIFHFLSLLFAGLILIWIFRFYMINTVQTAYSASLKSIGVGLLILILTPIVAVLFLITTIGWPFFLILMALWLIALFIAKLIAIMMIGMKIIKVNIKSGFGRTYGAFALGALIFMLLTLIPVIGWVLKFILVLMGLGAITLYEMGLFKGLRKKKMI